MQARPYAMALPIRAGLIVLLGLLMPLSAFAAPSPTSLPAKPIDDGRRLAAYPMQDTMPSDRLSRTIGERDLRGRIAEARRALIVLQAFVEQASLVSKLGDRLKVRKLENDRLRRLLHGKQAARNAFEIHVRPAETLVSALTKTVVTNWLETVRLKHRSDDAHHDLTASEASWLRIERRVASLQRTLDLRKAEILALRADRAALSVELGRMRRQIVKTDNTTDELQRDRERIAAKTRALHQGVASGLRRILLENGER